MLSVKNIKVYDLEESVIACRNAMRTEPAEYTKEEFESWMACCGYLWKRVGTQLSGGKWYLMGNNQKQILRLYRKMRISTKKQMHARETLLVHCMISYLSLSTFILSYSAWYWNGHDYNILIRIFDNTTMIIICKSCFSITS